MLIKAAIDTNVIVSGLIKSPSCRKVIRALEKKEFVAVVSPAIISELVGVISRPKFKGAINQEIASKIVYALKSQALLVRPSVKIDAIKADPDDNMFLEAAITAKANVIVSMDKHLLALVTFRNIPIVLPEEFLKRLHRACR